LSEDGFQIVDRLRWVRPSQLVVANWHRRFLLAVWPTAEKLVSAEPEQSKDIRVIGTVRGLGQEGRSSAEVPQSRVGGRITGITPYVVVLDIGPGGALRRPQEGQLGAGVVVEHHVGAIW
jgi:hypothetical protein